MVETAQSEQQTRSDMGWVKCCEGDGAEESPGGPASHRRLCEGFSLDKT